MKFVGVSIIVLGVVDLALGFYLATLNECAAAALMVLVAPKCIAEGFKIAWDVRVDPDEKWKFYDEIGKS